MVQYDCPYIDTTDDYDVSFYAKQWDFNAAEEVLETRIMTSAPSPTELDRGLDRLGEHDNLEQFELLSRRGEKALIRSQIAETRAMEAIRSNNGYITGPFHIANGSETWRVGFDSRVVADRALSDLDRHNDFHVVSRTSVDLADYYDVLEHIDVATGFLDGCRNLSKVERETLSTAVEAGYFTRPRDADLGSLADEFDVSKTAVSKNLRRAQRKILEHVADAIDVVEDETGSDASN